MSFTAAVSPSTFSISFSNCSSTFSVSITAAAAFASCLALAYSINLFTNLAAALGIGAETVVLLSR
jgi:hypothetical protein